MITELQFYITVAAAWFQQLLQSFDGDLQPYKYIMSSSSGGGESDSSSSMMHSSLLMMLVEYI